MAGISGLRSGLSYKNAYCSFPLPRTYRVKADIPRRWSSLLLLPSALRPFSSHLVLTSPLIPPNSVFHRPSLPATLLSSIRVAKYTGCISFRVVWSTISNLNLPLHPSAFFVFSLNSQSSGFSGVGGAIVAAKRSREMARGAVLPRNDCFLTPSELDLEKEDAN